MMTKELPCPEIERSSVMPSTVFTTSSIGCATSDSISAGDAPGSLVDTNTDGRSTGGVRSTPSLK